MQELVERIQKEGIHIGGGIVKVDGFLNHQVDAELMSRIGVELANPFRTAGISKVITAETSGILPALTTANELGCAVIYARKQMSSSMQDDYFIAKAISRTRSNPVTLRISKRYLTAQDRVLLIDDFLATGSTLQALVAIVQQSGATLCGIGCVIEKPQEGGRERFSELQLPIVTLAKIALHNDSLEVFE
ncbi:MAG: xanthine phosphoribosyltransferase [Candidatus Competibacteraceae bacterium]|nr:xanthine phosphoribosyltransferase [Candidatus Competibacteraceae bacterium]